MLPINQMINLYNNKHDFYNKKVKYFRELKHILIVYSIQNMIFYKHILLYLHWTIENNRSKWIPILC